MRRNPLSNLRSNGLRENRVSGDREKLEDTIYNKCGVTCRVRIDNAIRVTTRDYGDWILAKAALADSNPAHLLILREPVPSV